MANADQTLFIPAISRSLPSHLPCKNILISFATIMPSSTLPSITFCCPQLALQIQLAISSFPREVQIGFSLGSKTQSFIPFTLPSIGRRVMGFVYSQRALHFAEDPRVVLVTVAKSRLCARLYCLPRIDYGSNDTLPTLKLRAKSTSDPSPGEESLRLFVTRRGNLINFLRPFHA